MAAIEGQGTIVNWYPEPTRPSMSVTRCVYYRKALVGRMPFLDAIMIASKASLSSGATAT
jgi:hypothetical protein